MPDRVATWLAVVLLISAGTLAWSAALSDSVTVDEPSHIVAGYSSLVTGDYRLSPDHPPLARWLLVLPLLGQPVVWQAEGTPAWRQGDFLTLGRVFLEQWNDGQRLVRGSRLVAIVMWLAAIVAIALTARELHGRAGALLAMSVVAFDPGWLGHGHLATIDVPFALAVVTTLFTAHRWLAAPTPWRLALFAATFATVTLVKFSWPTLVPALAVMAVVARADQGARAVARTLAFGTAALALATIVAIWMAYGWRFDAVTTAGDADAARPRDVHMLVPLDYGRPLPRTADAAWEMVLHDPETGADRPGPVVPLLRMAHAHRLLPEAYLFGVAFVEKKAQGRAAYLRGEYSNSGFATYFPWALVVKTPLPTLLLFAAGLLALARRQSGDRRSRPLAVGLGVFAVTYLAVLMTSGLNLGYRHLLPVTAVLAITTGALVGGDVRPGAGRATRVALALTLAWLVIGTLRAAPHWIGYFNEAVGGWRNGHRYLADSNLDWGQDLLRLRTRLDRDPPDTAVWLSQAGNPPLPPGLAVRSLLGDGSRAPDPAPIGAGLYVVSASDLLGVYRPLARVASWRDPNLIARFERAAEDAANRGPVRGTDAAAASPATIDAFEALRRLRLLARLAQRAPDERVGTSLFLFRLSQQQVDEWTRP